MWSLSHSSGTIPSPIKQLHGTIPQPYIGIPATGNLVLQLWDAGLHLRPVKWLLSPRVSVSGSPCPGCKGTNTRIWGRADGAFAALMLLTNLKLEVNVSGLCLQGVLISGYHWLSWIPYSSFKHCICLIWIPVRKLWSCIYHFKMYNFV